MGGGRACVGGWWEGVCVCGGKVCVGVGVEVRVCVGGWVGGVCMYLNRYAVCGCVGGLVRACVHK